MKIYERILALLEDGPKTTKEIRHAIPDKNLRCLGATISNYPNIFLRLDKGLVGLKNRDDTLVKDWKRQGLPLYKKMANCLIDGPKRVERLCKMLPREKRVSIRATATMHPELFIRIKYGFIGRRGRDEYLAERHEKITVRGKRREKHKQLSDLLALILSDSPKTIDHICRLIPDVPKQAITWRLRMDKKFSIDKNGLGMLNYN